MRSAAVRRLIGEPLDWATHSWTAACALWLDVPLVTHDKDLQGIPDLRVLTVHDKWRIGEETLGETAPSGIWIGRVGEGANRYARPLSLGENPSS